MTGVQSIYPDPSVFSIARLTIQRQIWFSLK
uniref:Uncharacterized protein n=1 Tax=Arundo donax TaxID=35708 RepID=A0A0A9HTQ9_ARUDO